jgi:hypothetical protein
VAGQLAGIDALDGHDALAGQEVGQALLGTPVRRGVTHVAHHEAAGEHRARLRIGAVHTVVADVRHRHGDDLARVRGVGQDLLVAGQRGVEADLAVGLTGRAARPAFEHGAVLERE